MHYCFVFFFLLQTNCLNLFIGLVKTCICPTFEWILLSNLLSLLCQAALTQPSDGLSEAGQLSECSHAKKKEKKPFCNK